MALSKEAAASMDRVNQRDCLVFSSNLYNFTMCHPDIQRFLPPPMPEEKDSLFTENIGKTVSKIWYAKLGEFRRYEQYNLKLLVGLNMQEHLHHCCGSMLEAKNNIFSAVIYMSAFLMEMHMFLYQRSYEGALKRLPALWTSIFQTHFAQQFFLKGGWMELKSYARDSSEKFEELSFVINNELNFCFVTKHEGIKLNRTNEFRLFVVQKCLQILNMTHENLIRGDKTFEESIDQLKFLYTVINQIVELCKNLDSGHGDIEILNDNLRLRIIDITVEFYNKGELKKFLDMVRQHPRDDLGVIDPNAACEQLEDCSESPTFFTEEELEDINAQWLEEIAMIRKALHLVMPPGIDESNIDVILDEDYADNLITELGGLQARGNTLRNVGLDVVLAELNNQSYSVWGVPGQMFGKRLLEDRIKALQAKFLGRTPPKSGPSSVRPESTGGACPKSPLSSLSEPNLSAATGGESSKSNLESSAEDPTLEEIMKNLNLSSEKQESPEKKSSKSTRRKRKGSKR